MALFKKRPSMRLEQISTPEWHLPEGSTASGKVRIDGHFDGTIAANDSVVIGESAMITGDIKAVSIIVSGTVRGDITGSERIEIYPSAKVFGNLIAPQVVGQAAQDPQEVRQGTQDPEFTVSPKRARMWRVAVPGAALAALGGTLLIAYLHDWRGNIADESVRVATLGAKPEPAHATRELSPLSGAHFAHRETSRATVRPIAPESTAPASRAPSEALSTFAVKVPTAGAFAALNGATYGPTSATTSASSVAAPNAPASPSNLMIEIPHRVPAPVAPDYTVRSARKDGSVAPGSGRSVFPLTHVEAIASAAGHWTHASPLPVEPKVPRIANAELPSPLVKQSDIDSNSQGTEGTVRAGTRITISNWEQYRAFMPDGMIALFSGKYGLRMPNDIEMDVGPPIHIVAPRSFREASEKYSGDVRVVHLPNGRNDIANYVAGEPFPVPQGPDKGYEILADLWYTYSPHLAVGMPGGGLWNVTMLDRFGNATTAKWAFVYRQLAFNTDLGVPRTDPRADGAFYTQWLMTEEPEQAKYTTDLDILPQNAQQNELNFIFLPALRRSVAVSVSARCAPLLGTDWTHDDQKPGFNGGLANFDADYLRNMKVLALVNLSEAVSDFPRQYDMPLGFARPSWGRWSLRNVWVINIHRIPSEAAGYCYAKRIEYIDEETARSLWEDLYDSNRNLWKVTLSAYFPRQVPGTDGETIYGRFAASTWDLQNQHATLGNSTDPSGRLIMFNAEVSREFDNVTQYSMPGGLMQIMR
ncbi:MAG: DUF1329 domain-containing protein [Candidatus Binataceae bacterium]